MALKSGVLTWEIQKAKADKFRPQIEGILRDVAGHIIKFRPANSEEDQNKATDYVIEMSGGCIACRIRDWDYYKRYKDFTLRYTLPSGAKTEIEKIREGFGDWYLYAWQDRGLIKAWILVDLHCFREAGIDDPDGEKPNLNGSSTFLHWSLAKLRRHGCIEAERLF